MATIASISSPGGAMWQQIQSRQTQREADQAMQVARALQSQASDARASAERAQQSARSLEVKANQALARAAQASAGVELSKSTESMQTKQADVYSKLPETVTRSNPTVPKVDAAALTATASTTPAVGSVINTTA